jgi:hypothetical protein
MKRDRKRRWKKPYPVSDYDPATWPGSIHSTCADRVVGFWSVIFGVGGLVPCIPIVCSVGILERGEEENAPFFIIS